METRAEREARLRREREERLRREREARLHREQASLAGAVVGAMIAILGALIMGLFSKNKAVRVFSAICLLAIGIGAVYYYRTEIMDHTPDHPQVQYLKMREKSFRDECGSFANPSAIGKITPDVRTNMTTILLFRDILRPLGVTDEAFKASFESGGFEELHSPTAAKRVADYMDSRNSTYENDSYFRQMSGYKDALEKCLFHVDMPDWKRQELRIRAYLHFFLRDGKDLCEMIMKAPGKGADEMYAAVLTLEATEMNRVCSSLEMDNGLARFPHDVTTSAGCADYWLNHASNCRGIKEKWIREVGKWGIACRMPGSSPDYLPILVSPGFPCENLVIAGSHMTDAVEFANPLALVRKDGRVTTLHAGHRYTWGEVHRDSHGADIQAVRGVKYLTPKGVVLPIAESPAIPAPSEGRSEGVQTSQTKTTSANLPVDASKPGAVTPDSKPKVNVAQQNPHVAEALKYDWPRRCQKEWGAAFVGIQRVFSELGGFVLAQPPVEDFGPPAGGDEWGVQTGVPLQKAYWRFQTADLEFFHGALRGFTLKVHFASSYSRDSINREYEAMAADVVSRLARLHRPDLGVTFDVDRLKSVKEGIYKASDISWFVEFGGRRLPSEHDIGGQICTMFNLDESSNGYDLSMSVTIQHGIDDLVRLVLQRTADAAGKELPAL